MRTRVGLCARVCTYVNKGGASCWRYKLTPYLRTSYIGMYSFNFLPCGTICFFLRAGDVATCGAFDRALN